MTTALAIKKFFSAPSSPEIETRPVTMDELKELRTALTAKGPDEWDNFGKACCAALGTTWEPTKN